MEIGIFFVAVAGLTALILLGGRWMRRRQSADASALKQRVATILADLSPQQLAAVDLFAWAERDGWRHVAHYANQEKLR